jgi:hypothetical protein
VGKQSCINLHSQIDGPGAARPPPWPEAGGARVRRSYVGEEDG